MTPENSLPNRNTTPADPLAGIQALTAGQPLGEPSANEMSQGVLDGLRQVLAITTTTARTVPGLAEKMRTIRQSTMEAMMQVQTMTEGGSEGEGTSY
jgi:hypothetical protein